MANETADRIIRQSRALVKAIEGLSEVDPGGPIERLMIRMLVDSYKQRLLVLTAAFPTWAVERILSTSGHIGDDRAAVWTKNNRVGHGSSQRRHLRRCQRERRSGGPGT
jgi:hypothetical protein